MHIHASYALNIGIKKIMKILLKGTGELSDVLHLPRVIHSNFKRHVLFVPVFPDAYKRRVLSIFARLLKPRNHLNSGSYLGFIGVSPFSPRGNATIGTKIINIDTQKEP